MPYPIWQDIAKEHFEAVLPVPVPVPYGKGTVYVGYQEIGFDMFDVEQRDGHATVQGLACLSEDGIILAVPVGAVAFSVAEHAVHGKIVFFHGVAPETVMGIHVFYQETSGLLF